MSFFRSLVVQFVTFLYLCMHVVRPLFLSVFRYVLFIYFFMYFFT